MSSISIGRLYSHKIRTHLSKKLQRFVLWSLYCWYSAALMWFVPFFGMNGIVNSSGYTGSLWSSGFTSFTILITVHHGSVIIGTRNFTLPLVILYLFSYACFMPLTTVLCDLDPGAHTYRIIFADVMGGTPLYWLSVFLSVMAICLPIYAAKACEMILNAPQFYQKED